MQEESFKDKSEKEMIREIKQLRAVEEAKKAVEAKKYAQKMAVESKVKDTKET